MSACRLSCSVAEPEVVAVEEDMVPDGGWYYVVWFNVVADHGAGGYERLAVGGGPFFRNIET